MSWAYITVEQLAKTLAITEKKLDEEMLHLLRDVIEAVTQQIDRHTERTFRTYNATHLFTPEFYDMLLVPDLLDITSLKIDYNIDRVYERTLNNEHDYYLEPTNSPIRERPYTRIKLRSRTRFYFPEFEESVQIVGKWGFWESMRKSRTTLGQNIDELDDIFDVSDIQRVKIGWTIKVGDEQMYVSYRDESDSTIEVERGINGTVAVPHNQNDAILYYVYPRPLIAATLLQAARIYRRTETPLGIVNNPGDIGWRAVYVPLLDLDVQTLLKVLRKQNIP